MKQISAAVAAGIAAMTIAGPEAVANDRSYTIVLRNQCHSTVNVALRVKRGTGSWVTTGWQVLKPRRIKFHKLWTRNRIFYIYAYTANGSMTWSGRNRQGAIMRPIIKRGFRHFSGPLSGPGYQMVPFRKIVIAPRRHTYSFPFRCN